LTRALTDGILKDKMTIKIQRPNLMSTTIENPMIIIRGAQTIPDAPIIPINSNKINNKMPKKSRKNKATSVDLPSIWRTQETPKRDIIQRVPYIMNPTSDKRFIERVHAAKSMMMVENLMWMSKEILSQLPNSIKY
jgi:hypothetical protein